MYTQTYLHIHTSELLTDIIIIIYYNIHEEEVMTNDSHQLGITFFIGNNTQND